MLDAKKTRGTILRFITEITKDNISYCKQIMENVELRHLDGVKGNFGVSDTEYIAISTTPTRTAADDIPEPVPAATPDNPHRSYARACQSWCRGLPTGRPRLQKHGELLPDPGQRPPVRQPTASRLSVRHFGEGRTPQKYRRTTFLRR